MNQTEFSSRRQAAIENMRQMNARSAYNKNEQSNQKQQPEPPPIMSKNPHPQKSSFNLPIIGDLLKDGDAALIIGLLLILMNEKCDKKLLLALVYILL